MSYEKSRLRTSLFIYSRKWENMIDFPSLSRRLFCDCLTRPQSAIQNSLYSFFYLSAVCRRFRYFSFSIRRFWIAHTNFQPSFLHL
jgi:hypothetical protein